MGVGLSRIILSWFHKIYSPLKRISLQCIMSTVQNIHSHMDLEVWKSRIDLQKIATLKT